MHVIGGSIRPRGAAATASFVGWHFDAPRLCWTQEAAAMRVSLTRVLTALTIAGAAASAVWIAAYESDALRDGSSAATLNRP
jgi:hypothetical protein